MQKLIVAALFLAAPAAASETIPAPADVAAAPADAKRTASGLAYRVLKSAQSKDRPTAEDKVEVHYTGWTTDGKMFDSSVTRGRTSTFPLKAVIKGWTEGLQLMAVGDKTRFWIPAELAYGKNPGGGRPAGLLVFDVELFAIIRGPKAPSTPTDLKKPSRGARRTMSGLAWKVLKKGTGNRNPRARDRVEVHYSGWTPDGKMFDSSVTRGEPAVFPLSGVIKGWTEGVQLMVEGEKSRFWIPAKLAYGENPRRGAPAGDLVFDIELIAIK